jgi:hypothetical protein
VWRGVGLCGAHACWHHLCCRDHLVGGALTGLWATSRQVVYEAERVILA